MNTLNRFKAPFVMAVALAVPVVTNGCSAVEDAQAAVCCTEFKAGASIDAKIGGGARGQVAVQAVADFAGIASAAISDLTSACRGMAGELGAAKADLDSAENAGAGGKPDDIKRAQMDAYCQLALKSIASVKATAGATFKLDFKPPVCEASISAKANCQAKCDVKGECKANVEPPRCTGGKLEVSCKGGCTGKAGASVSCTGKCTGSCKGNCNATGGVAVKCEGKCEGKCSAAADGSGNGVNAQGECTGFCDAKCTANATAPAVTCSGSCEGECSASCQGSAEVAVKCDGECMGTAEPIKCTGGKLEGGCNVEAKCEGNCDASVKAKAECRPPELRVSFSGAANVEAAARLQAVFEANLGIVLAFKARLEGMLELAGTITGNADVVVEIKAACIPAVIAAAVAAAGDVKASAEISGKLVTSL